jgi:hypothetical protein
VNTLRAALKEKDQRLLALEAKFDSFSHGQTDGGNKRKKTAKKNEKECNYCKKTGKWFQGHDESECLHKKKDETEAGLLAIKERREHTVKGRQSTKSDKKALLAGTLINKGQATLSAAGDDQIQRCLKSPCYLTQPCRLSSDSCS